MTPAAPAAPSEAIARAFHEAYERLAPRFGYETRKASAVPWEQVPQGNRDLMAATVGSLLESGVIAAPGTAGGAQEAATPGQAAYEAHRAVVAVSLGLDLNGDDDFDGPPAEWAALAPSGRAAWEAAAAAAWAPERDRLNAALAEIAELMARVDKLDADCTLLTATLTRLGNSHAGKREALERIRDGKLHGAAHARAIATDALEATP